MQSTAISKKKKYVKPRVSCKKCSATFSRHPYLVGHMLKVHQTVIPASARKPRLKATADNPRPFKCDQCDKCYIKKKHLARHKLTHIGTLCKLCNQYTDIFANHMRNVHNVEVEKPFECYLCKRTYLKSGLLRHHMKSHISDGNRYVCDVCNSEFYHATTFRLHRNSHQARRKRRTAVSICFVCGKIVNKDTLKNHMLIHTGIKPIECTLCDQTFRIASSLKLHMRTHTGERPFQCELCVRRFADASTKRVHMRCHTGQNPYVCHLCGRRTKQAQNLKSHYQHAHRNLEITGKEIRLNGRIFERFEQCVLNRYLQRDGNLITLLAEGLSDYNRELKEQSEMKAMTKASSVQRIAEMDIGEQNQIKQNDRNSACDDETDEFENDNNGDEIRCNSQTNSFKVDAHIKEETLGWSTPNTEIVYKPESKIELYPIDNFTQNATTIERAHNYENQFVDVSCQIKGEMDEEEPLIAFNKEENVEEFDVHDDVKSVCSDFQHSDITESDDNSFESKNIGAQEIAVDAHKIQDEPNRVHCRLCNQNFAKRRYMLKHMRNVHKTTYKAMFPTPEPTPDNPRPFKCNLCDKGYIRQKHLRRHKQTTHKPVLCKLCKEWFADYGDHMKNVHQTEIRAPEPKITKKQQLVEARAKRELEKEMKKREREAVAITEKCGLCDNRYSVRHWIKCHTNPHDRPFECIACHKLFIKISALRLHLATHWDDAVCVCHLCGKGFKMRGQLSKHITIIHTTERKHLCNFCPKKFKSAYSAVLHARTHNAEKNFHCTFCPERYASQHSLTLHLRRHSGEKPYVCPFPNCNKAFADNSTHRQHVRVHTGEKPYACHLCDHRTTQAGNLKSHYRHFHKLIVKSVSMFADKAMEPILGQATQQN